MDKFTWGLLAFIILFGSFILFGPLNEVVGYQEITGHWTASEKRQVISLLKEIAENTR